jgi:hypothetical protein
MLDVLWTVFHYSGDDIGTGCADGVLEMLKDRWRVVIRLEWV